MKRKFALLDDDELQEALSGSGLTSLENASIRDIVRLVNDIEKRSPIRFVRMEMGVPGLPPPDVATEAEIDALRRGVASKYPQIEGEPMLKEELALFIERFLDVTVDPKCCVPAAGAMQGAMATFLSAGRREVGKDTVLFIDPGFPVQKTQLDILGIKWLTFDIHDYRGRRLMNQLEGFMQAGNISLIVYSNPNNPTWICLDEEELQIIGMMAQKYDVVVMEDLAYFAMDLRTDYSVPSQAPFQPSIAKYTDNYILLLSGSKVFSYAGQRIAACIISPVLYERKFPDLKRFFNYEILGRAFIWGALYVLSSGTSHSVQYAFAALLNAANTGRYNIIEGVKVYGERAKKMKRIFLDNGFYLVYDHDNGKDLADGFYFSICYPGFKGAELLRELLLYGISSISLENTGSTREGIRACVSQIGSLQMACLEERVANFHLDHHS